MKERKFVVEILIKSVRGISHDRAMLTLLKMEIAANQEGDPRVHFTVKEELTNAKK
jgi:hypothetical protein